MRFEEKTEFGLHGEHVAMELLRNQEGLNVTLNTGPGYEAGFGKRFHSSDGTEVIPDIQGYRAGVWPRQPFWIEVKTKSAFACYENARNELRTGIDIKKWHAYRWFRMTQGPVEFHILFIHPLSVAQMASGLFRIIEPSIAGIYTQTLEYLDANAISGSDRKFYWPLTELKLWRSAAWLDKERSTKDLWSWLVAKAKRRTQADRLVA